MSRSSEQGACTSVGTDRDRRTAWREVIVLLCLRAASPRSPWGPWTPTLTLRRGSWSLSSPRPARPSRPWRCALAASAAVRGSRSRSSTRWPGAVLLLDALPAVTAVMLAHLGNLVVIPHHPSSEALVPDPVRTVEVIQSLAVAMCWWIAWRHRNECRSTRTDE